VTDKWNTVLFYRVSHIVMISSIPGNMEILKTDLSRFDKIKDFPFRENYAAFNELQMHYVDEGKGEIILALHGEPTWSYLYRKFIPVLKNYRFIAPDFIGFGKSDKIAGWRNYTFDLHFKSLENLIEKLNLEEITLVVQDWGGLLGLSVLAAHQEKFKRVVIMNTALPTGKKLSLLFRLWIAFARFYPTIPVGLILQIGTYSRLPLEVIDAYKAPFPAKRYKAGIKAFPLLVPKNPNDQGVDKIRKSRQVLSAWKKPTLIIFSENDPVFSGHRRFFDNLIPDSKVKRKIDIPNAGHFLQEDKGREISQHIDLFMKAF